MGNTKQTYLVPIVTTLTVKKRIVIPVSASSEEDATRLATLTNPEWVRGWTFETEWESALNTENDIGTRVIPGTVHEYMNDNKSRYLARPSVATLVSRDVEILSCEKVDIDRN